MKVKEGGFYDLEGGVEGGSKGEMDSVIEGLGGEEIGFEDLLG